MRDIVPDWTVGDPKVGFSGETDLLEHIDVGAIAKEKGRPDDAE